MIKQFIVNQFQFSRTEKSGILVAEASSLGFSPGYFPAIFDVYSPITSKTIRFTADAARREDGDLLEVVYRVVNPPKNDEYITKFKVCILND